MKTFIKLQELQDDGNNDEVAKLLYVPICAKRERALAGNLRQVWLFIAV